MKFCFPLPLSLPIPLLAAAAALFGLTAAPPAARAQCGTGFGFHGGGGIGFGHEYGGFSRGGGIRFSFGNRGYSDCGPVYRSDRIHFDDGCDLYRFPRRTFEFRILRRDTRVFHSFDCRCEICEKPCPRDCGCARCLSRSDYRRTPVRRPAAPSVPAAAGKAEARSSAPAKGVVGDDTVPFRNAPIDNRAPKKTPGYLDLPDPAPRQERDSREPAPGPAPKTDGGDARAATTEKVGLFDRFKRGKKAAGTGTAAAKRNSFPLDVVLTDDRGDRTSLRKVIGDNQAVLVDFWAEWCGPCIQGMPVLKQRATSLARHGVVVAGVNVDSDEAAAARVRDRFGLDNLAWLVEPKTQDFSRKYNIRSIPFMLLIDRDGNVLFQGHPHDRKLEKVLDDLTKKNTLALR